MKAISYRPGFNSEGRALQWLNDLGNQSGAYVIRNASTGAVLYVGESHTGRLADTIKRHFYKWDDTAERRHYTYQKGRVEIGVRLCPPGAAVSAQNNLIRRLNPRDNTNGFNQEPF